MRLATIATRDPNRPVVPLAAVILVFISIPSLVVRFLRPPSGPRLGTDLKRTRKRLLATGPHDR
jgi:hypothetical protein